MRSHSTLFAVAMILTAAPAMAADEPAQATSPADDTPAQVEAFIHDAPPLKVDTNGDAPLLSAPPRDGRVHGEVAVAAGSHGYRSVYLRTDVPVGESGHLSIAITQSHGGGWRGHEWGGRPGPVGGLAAPLSGPDGLGSPSAEHGPRGAEAEDGQSPD